MNIYDKVFVITGAGSGLGYEIALGLLERGARVAALDLRSNGLKILRQKANADIKNLSIHTIDITKPSEVSKLPKLILEYHSSIDGLINCAGIIQPFASINDTGIDIVERVMNTNFYGTLYMVKAFLPQLLKRPEASLVNISSMGGFLPVPGQGAYGASKAAVKLLTESLYAELIDTPVHVSVVFPGATNTNIAKNSNIEGLGKSIDTSSNLKSKTLPADKAAKIIIDGIIKGKPQIFTGNDAKLMNALYRIRPTYATKLIAKQLKSLLS